MKNLTYNDSYIFHLYQELNILRNNKGDTINVGNIAGEIFYLEAVFSKWKSKIYCCLFLPHFTHLYVPTEMSLKSG